MPSRFAFGEKALSQNGASRLNRFDCLKGFAGEFKVSFVRVTENSLESPLSKFWMIGI